jgi:hypothetical protein
MLLLLSLKQLMRFSIATDLGFIRAEIVQMKEIKKLGLPNLLT